MGCLLSHAPVLVFHVRARVFVVNLIQYILNSMYEQARLASYSDLPIDGSNNWYLVRTVGRVGPFSDPCIWWLKKG